MGESGLKNLRYEPMGSSWADWRCWMDFGPVEGIRRVGPVGMRRVASDVMPAAGVQGAARMEEDSYGGSKKEEDRGLDEDVDEVNEEAGQSGESKMPQENASEHVDLIA